MVPFCPIKVSTEEIVESNWMIKTIGVDTVHVTQTMGCVVAQVALI